MTENFRSFEGAANYEFGAPDGVWKARLDHKAWGKGSNLILYFSDLANDQKYWFSVFWADGYRPRDKGINFKEDANVGDTFEVTTSKTRTGKHVFMAARKLVAPTP